jgi:hypothetical protein
MMRTLEKYLKENIDDNVTIIMSQEKSKFPVFLRDLYNFYDMKILDTRCMLLEIIEEAPSVDVIEKHVRRIEELTNQKIVLYYKEITRYRRKSLVAYRIPFVVEDGQIYLPFFGLDFKKSAHYDDRKVKIFSTSAQLAFLYFLYNKDAVVNTTEFAKNMGFTTMTASRALNDLYDARLVKFDVGGKTGRSKKYKRIPNPEYFEIGQKFMVTPVKKVVYTKKAPENAPIAGLEALSALSMINAPGHPVRALSEKQMSKLDIEIINNQDMIKDQKYAEIEIWKYDPQLFTNTNQVNLFSLYVSLKEETDERIEQAIRSALRGETWYTA